MTRKTILLVLLFTTLLASAQSQNQAATNPTDAPLVMSPTAPTHSDPTRIRVGGSVQGRKLIRSVQPIYPADAKSRHVTGTVLLHVIVAQDGSVQEIEVVSGPDELRQSAIDAVKQWRFKPTLLNGKPVEVDTKIQLVYNLS